MERSFGDTALARMIHVGMESGRLPLFLERSAHLMTEETKRKLTGFRKILEPSLLLFVGLVTAAIIFSVLLPVSVPWGRTWAFSIEGRKLNSGCRIWDKIKALFGI